MANDTLVYDAYNYAYTTEMERTKGKLIIQVTNLPTAVHYSDKTITALRRNGLLHVRVLEAYRGNHYP